MTDLDRDTIYLATNAFAEASDQGQEGIRWQIHSTINRWRVRRWYSKKTIAATVMAPFAYSAENTTDPNRVRALETPMDHAVMQICMAEAEAALAGRTEDPTSGATHYYAVNTAEPSWVSGKDPKSGAQIAPPARFCGQNGNHLFFGDVA